jgi:hypothetical protein
MDGGELKPCLRFIRVFELAHSGPDLKGMLRLKSCLAAEHVEPGCNVTGQAIEIVGQSMRTDNAISFDAESIRDRSVIDMVGFPMAEACAKEAFAQAKLTPDDVQVVELHDCFSCNGRYNLLLGLACFSCNGRRVSTACACAVVLV